MSLTHEQMRPDTERGTRTGMEWNARSPKKHLLLHVWLGLLTVAVLVMAAFLASIKSEDEVQTQRSSPPGSSLSCIQLMKFSDKPSWQEYYRCESSLLVSPTGSIHFLEEGLYFLYAQVAFTKNPTQPQSKSVLLIRNPTYGRDVLKLAEGIFSPTAEGSVWVANVVRLKQNDTVSINVTGDFLSDITFWGAYGLQSR